MSQNVFIPKDSKLDIGAISLTPEMTNFTLGPGQTIHNYRAFGEDYERKQPGGLFYRTIGLTGLYDGDAARNIGYTLKETEQTFRLVIDAGVTDRVHAGTLLTHGYQLNAPTDDIVTIEGASDTTGTVYIGEGDYLSHENSADWTLTRRVLPYKFVAIHVTNLGTNTNARSNQRIRINASQSGSVVARAVFSTIAALGVYIAEIVEVSDGAVSDGVTDDWTLALEWRSYDVNPTFRISLLRPEGTFD